MTEPGRARDAANVLDLARHVSTDRENFVVARTNDHVVRLAVLRRDFHWHAHHNSDETFIVLEGTLDVDFEDRTIRMGPGDCLTIPKGVRHRTRAVGRAVNLAFERADTNTAGDG